jgi:DNA-binding NarL/FixJ family response regulator
MKLEKTHAILQASQWQYCVEQLQAGLAQEIDDHMTAWKLSAAEKEIGMLLLKGLSLREIAEVRGTSERTVRQQSLAIYSKAAVAGRAELSAFFMEDFLDRKQTIQESRPLDL